MPSTITAINTFTAGDIISSNEMDNNFSNLRGNILPLSESAEAASNLSYSVGQSDYKFTHVYGSEMLNVKSTASGYTILNTDGFIRIDSSSSATTSTLPTAVGIAGKKIVFQKTDSSFNIASLDGNGTETIAGPNGTTQTTAIHTIGESVEVVSDGTNWLELRRDIPSIRTSFTPDLTAATSAPTIGNGVLNGFYQRNGDLLSINIFADFSSTSTFGTGNWGWGLPGSLAVDSLKSGTINVVYSGWGSARDSGATGNREQYSVIIFSTTECQAVGRTDSGTEGRWGPSFPFTWAAGDNYTLDFTVPISGWNG